MSIDSFMIHMGYTIAAIVYGKLSLDDSIKIMVSNWFMWVN